MERYWKKYLKADMLEREKIILKLYKKVIKGSLKNVQRLPISETKKDKLVAQWLNSYFDDLAGVAESRETK